MRRRYEQEWWNHKKITDRPPSDSPFGDRFKFIAAVLLGVLFGCVIVATAFIIGG